MSDLITYDDKIRLKSQNVSDKYKVTAEDMNEIKKVVNTNVEIVDEINKPESWVSVGTEAPTDGRRVWFSKSKNLISGWQQGFWGTTDGSYNGTRTDYICTHKIPVKPNTTYTYSHGIGETTIYVMQYEKNDNYLRYNQISNSSQVQITTTENTYYIGIDITKGGIAISPSNMREGQLKESTTASPYEPYIEPSIKVDNEDFISMSDLVSVGINKPSDGKRVWFKKSKNLLPQNQYITSTTINGITYTNNGDGTFNLTGTATANTTIVIIPTNIINLEANQPYYLYSSVPYDENTFNLTIAMTDNSTTKFIFANNTYTPTTTPTKVRVQFYINNGKSVNATNIKLMLIKGNTAPSEYEPYVDEEIYVDDEELFRKNLFEDVTSKVSVSFVGGSISASDIGSLTAQNFYHIAPHIYIGNLVLTNVTPHYNNDQMQITFEVNGIGTILKCVGSGGNYDRQFASVFDGDNNNIYVYIQKGANASTSNFGATYRCIFITLED